MHGKAHVTMKGFQYSIMKSQSSCVFLSLKLTPVVRSAGVAFLSAERSHSREAGLVREEFPRERLSVVPQRIKDNRAILH